jgi:hypothetical protein
MNPNNDRPVNGAPDDGISSISWSPKANYFVATSWNSQVGRLCVCVCVCSVLALEIKSSRYGFFFATRVVHNHRRLRVVVIRSCVFDVVARSKESLSRERKKQKNTERGPVLILRVVVLDSVLASGCVWPNGRQRRDQTGRPRSLQHVERRRNTGVHRRMRQQSALLGSWL